MNINYVGKNLEVTDGLKVAVENKLSRLSDYFNAEKDVKVVMSTQKNTHKVEITISIKDIIIRAEETSDDMYVAIDDIVDKLERQIRKQKTKLQKKCHKSIRYDFYDEMNDESFEDEDNFKVVRRKSVDSKPMSEDEAILQLELLNHDFYVFRNLSNVINVIYKRKDKQYGIIELF